MTTKTFSASDITPTNTVKDTARLLASLIGEDEIFVHQPDGDQVGAVSVNTWNSEITLSHAAASRLLGAIRASLAQAHEDAYLVLDESDAVEVFHALDKTAQAYCTFGDKVTSAHFQGLYSKLVNKATT